VSLVDEVRYGHLLARLADRSRGGHDGLEDLDLVRARIFILVLIPPQGNIQLACERNFFWDDPPSVSICHDLLEGLVGQEVIEVPDWRCARGLQDSQRDVEVRSCQRPVECLLAVDGREELAGEFLAVFDELPLALCTLALHADPDLRPRAVEAFLEEAAQDALVDVLDVRRSTVTIDWSN